MLRCICRKLLFCAYAQSYACVASSGFHLPHVLVVTSRTLPLFCSHVFFFLPSLRAKRLLYYRLMTLSPSNPTNTPLIYLFFPPLSARVFETPPHRTFLAKKFPHPSSIHPHPFVEPPSFRPPSRRLSHACRAEAAQSRIPRRVVPCTTRFSYRLLFSPSTYVRPTFFLLLLYSVYADLPCPVVVRFIFFSSSYGPQTNLKNPNQQSNNVIPPTHFFFLLSNQIQYQCQ